MNSFLRELLSGVNQNIYRYIPQEIKKIERGASCCTLYSSTNMARSPFVDYETTSFSVRMKKAEIFKDLSSISLSFDAYQEDSLIKSIENRRFEILNRGPFFSDDSDIRKVIWYYDEIPEACILISGLLRALYAAINTIFDPFVSVYPRVTASTESFLIRQSGSGVKPYHAARVDDYIFLANSDSSIPNPKTYRFTDFRKSNFSTAAIEGLAQILAGME